jgi:hypothetical protein
MTTFRVFVTMLIVFASVSLCTWAAYAQQTDPFASARQRSAAGSGKQGEWTTKTSAACTFRAYDRQGLRKPLKETDGPGVAYKHPPFKEGENKRLNLHLQESI